ncbi:ABC transporter ATP-binding protein [Shewanella sp. Scap07]|uniref:ABC transporter ATP-binding protein n=1 Tax=Shewanella sp. Scap07 TaxID=2589987 RepID=UPI002117B937|nr:ABC transporter ATP-binding protein [Shewanella sp. Scap07]
MGMSALVELKQVGLAYSSRQDAVLDGVDLTLRAGECHLITGATGSGKSTLLGIIAGVVSRPITGELYTQAVVGMVMQDPQVQILRQTVGAEIAFVLENMAVEPSQMLVRVQHALRAVGLWVSLETPVDSLSLGQKYRLMLAAQLVCEPDVLLLDEPWAQLDDQGVVELSAVLKSLLARGIAIVIVEHQPQAFADFYSHCWHLHQGRLNKQASLFAVSQPKRYRPVQCAKQRQLLIEASAFSLQFTDGNCLFKCAGLQLFSGELVTLVGSNGAGKSTLLKTLLGAQADIVQVPIKVLGKRPKLGGFGQQLMMLFQRPSRQLFETTVLQELCFSLKRFNLPLERATSMLQRLGLSHLSEHSPHTLSYGQQHLIAIASLLCLQPKILLLDDPFAGLDDDYCQQVVALLNEAQQRGCGIVLASHRALPQLQVDRQWQIQAQYLSGGQLEVDQVG